MSWRNGQTLEVFLEQILDYATAAARSLSEDSFECRYGQAKSFPSLEVAYKA
jgi:hypothetical protein